MFGKNEYILASFGPKLIKIPYFQLFQNWWAAALLYHRCAVFDETQKIPEGLEQIERMPGES